MDLNKLKKFENNLSKDEQDEIILLREHYNFDICRKISYITLVVNLLVMVIYYILFRRLWSNIPGYKYLFYIHVSLIAGLSIYYTLVYLLKYVNSRRKLFKKIIYYYFIILTLLYCISLSINAELIHDHIYAYIIGIFAISYFFKFTNVEVLLLLGSSLVIFAAGSFLVNDNVREVYSYTINSVICIVFAYYVAKINNFYFIKHFINKKKLIKKNKQLKEQNRFKSIFLGNTSHELKTPLNLIYSAEQMLDLSVEKAIEDEEVKNKFRKYLRIIKQNSYRLMRLINNIVDATKMDTGEYKINFQNVDIVKIVTQIVQSVTDYVEDKGINISLNTALKEKVITCDPDSIERILLNLISNAVKYTPVDGRIDINLHLKKDQLVISVKDTGTGIAAELQDCIFKRYVQADDNLTKTSGGSGIGLSLVKYLVREHQGDIELNSVPGQGSEFIVKLPDRLIDKDNNESITNNECNIIDKDQRIENIKMEFSDIYKL